MDKSEKNRKNRQNPGNKHNAKNVEAAGEIVPNSDAKDRSSNANSGCKVINKK